MAKDPAFLFYSDSFLAGVADLTMEERGQYITLLCLQHQKGHLSEKLIRLSVGNARADVRAKFRQDSASLWYNARLDLEIEKRKNFSQSQSERASDGWKTRKSKNARAMPGIDINTIKDNLNRAVNEVLVDNLRSIYGNLDFDKEVTGFKAKVIAAPGKYQSYDDDSLRLAFMAQLRNGKNKPKDRAGHELSEEEVLKRISKQQKPPENGVGSATSPAGSLN